MNAASHIERAIPVLIENNTLWSCIHDEKLQHDRFCVTLIQAVFLIQDIDDLNLQGKIPNPEIQKKFETFLCADIHF